MFFIIALGFFCKSCFQKEKINEITENIEKDISNNALQNISEEDSNETEELENTQETEVELDNIGLLTIPDILLENAPIMEGTELEVLKNAIGHFESTSVFEGNVGLASHNSGGKGDYFKNLKNIKIGSSIYYKTKYGTKKYTVTFKRIISEDDFSYLKENPNNRITLITCTKGQKDKRLCVQALEA